MIKERLLFILKYWIYWLLFFFLLKTLFILYNIKLAIEVPFHTLIKAYLYGLRLDISTSTYFTVLPFLITIIDAYFPLKYFRTIVKTYTIFLLVLSCILIIVDIELYKYWGFRLDKTPLDYIDTPKEMFASVNFFTIIKLIFIGIVLWIISYWVFNKYILKTTYFNKKAKLISLPLLLIIFCSLLIPIRGGTGVAPINTGSAYYCSYQFANHSAINIIWNVVFSLLQTETNENPFISFKKEEAQKLFNELQSQNKNETISLISNSKPNIIVIILESFTSKAIPALGGIDSISITPRFNGLIKEGIFFNKFYCTGTRSDKGLLSLLTGFPALPNVLVMRFPEKTGLV